MNEERDFNDLAAVIRDGMANRPPKDTVPSQGATRDALLALDRIVAGSRIDAVIPPEISTDDTGLPTGVGEHTHARVAGAIVTRGRLERAGLTEADVPHLTIVGGDSQ